MTGGTKLRAYAAYLWLLAAAAGCSSDAASGPSTRVRTASGELQLELHMMPDPPVRGVDAAEIVVSDPSTGAAVDGLTLTVTPWMPAMNHGTSLIAQVTPQGGGVYDVANLDLYMPGLWELRTAISGAAPVVGDASPGVHGSIDDDATLSVEIP